MTAFFDTLFGGLSLAVAGFHGALENSAEQSLWDQCDQQDAYSSAAFAQADLLMLGWAEDHDEKLTIESHKNVTHNVKTIKEGLSERAGYLAGAERSPLDTRSGPDRIQEAVASIEQLLDAVSPKATGVLASENPESQLDAGKILNPKIRKSLDVLLYALAKQLSSCGHEHVARLKLTGFSDDIDHQMRLFFDLFLSSRFDWIPCRWLQSRCTIEKSLVETEGPGCQFIKESELHKQSLSLRLGEQPLGSLLRGQGSLCSDSAIPTVSLGFLIDNGFFKTTFTTGNKFFLPLDRATLCSTLARSLLHLSHDVWTRVKWDIDGIFFLEDPSTQTLADKNKPYLSWRLESQPSDTETQNGKSNQPEPSYNAHLVEFARLLMEVHAGERIPFSRATEELQPFLWTLIHDQRRFPSSYEQRFRVAVVACLGMEGREAAQDRSDPQRMQVFIFQKVLQNLDSYVQSWKEPQVPAAMPPPPPINSFSRQSTMAPNESPYDGQAYDCPQDSVAANNARDFVSRMEGFTNTHIQRRNNSAAPRLPLHLSQKIRIAIIDSGVKKDDTRISGARSRIRGGMNFIPGRVADDWNDEHGHGTHVAVLLLKMAPEAELFVAKVSDGWFVKRDEVNGIAQAVNWAVQEWQVDIITMSLVLQERHEAIEAGLREAVNPSYEGGCRRIVFAAAGNSGGNTSMPWPASMPGIIAIHATDGLGTAHNINPTAIAPESFATLGRDIQSRWKPKGSRPKDVFVSGTSFATPIAAAIAADVLEYARWNLRLTVDQKKLLYSGGYMRNIFARMMQSRSGYDYVQPWTLWKEGFGQLRDVRDVLRDVIAS